MVPGFLFAVHISDGILAPSWWLAGIGLTVLLALIGARRIRDEEIPRIALLTSAFFVASLIHVRVGPTSAHLLLGGLMGVVLGWRAALAIPIAVLLQYVFFVHGGYTTIGINSLVMTMPALLAYYLFGILRRLPWLSRPWFQMALIGSSSLVLVLSLVYSLALLWNRDVARISPANQLDIANAVTFHPITLAIAGMLMLLAIWSERNMGHAPEFSLGFLIGELTVLATVALNCFVLLEGGESNWTVPALILVVAHLPIAVVEGIVMGFTVSLLARVRPDILGMPTAVSSQQPAVSSSISANGFAGHPGDKICNLQSAICNPKTVILALLALFGLAGPAQAHRLEGEYKILPEQKVHIEAWFDLTGESPSHATVEVFRENGEVLTRGTLDKDGVFIFPFSQAESLLVVISAGAGHRKELRIPAADLARSRSGPSGTPQELSPADRSSRISIKDILMGLGFVLALAAFIFSWRNFRRLKELEVTKGAPETPHSAVPPTDPDRR
jgi:cobalt/nickel transport system permease protein